MDLNQSATVSLTLLFVVGLSWAYVAILTRILMAYRRRVRNLVPATAKILDQYRRGVQVAANTFQ